MTVSEFLKGRNQKIMERYVALRANKIRSSEAKKIISAEFNGISVSTIEQVIYNKSYANSPHDKK